VKLTRRQKLCFPPRLIMFSGLSSLLPRFSSATREHFLSENILIIYVGLPRSNHIVLTHVLRHISVVNHISLSTYRY
jgi:hypothetical protein